MAAGKDASISRGNGAEDRLDHAPAAHAASVLASQPLLQGLLGNASQDDEATVLSQGLLEALAVTMGEEVREEELVGVPQRQLGAKVDKEKESKRLEVVEEGDTEEKARLICQLVDKVLKSIGNSRQTKIGTEKDCVSLERSFVFPSMKSKILLHSAP